VDEESRPDWTGEKVVHYFQSESICLAPFGQESGVIENFCFPGDPRPIVEQ
jgi:hypothetical protein